MDRDTRGLFCIFCGEGAKPSRWPAGAYFPSGGPGLIRNHNRRIVRREKTTRNDQ